MWTEEMIQEKIQTRNDWLERAIVAIWNCQTSEEQSTESTRDANGKGFSAFDARMGSYWALWLKSGKHLSGKHLERARKVMKRYVKQLVKIANKQP